MRFGMSGAAAALLVAAAVTPALAEDAPGGALVPGMQLAQVPPPPMPMMSWTGLYVGVNGGWVDSSRDKIINTGTDTGIGGLGSALSSIGPFGGRQIPNQFNLSYSGWQAGGTIGYNLQVAPQWVLGVEADFDDGSASASKSFAFPGNATTVPFTSSFKRSVGFMSTERVRDGFLPTPTLMLFGSAGLAWGETTMRAQFICPTCAPPAST